jgi:hypothetical protein
MQEVLRKRLCQVYAGFCLPSAARRGVAFEVFARDDLFSLDGFDA